MEPFECLVEAKLENGMSMPAGFRVTLEDGPVGSQRERTDEANSRPSDDEIDVAAEIREAVLLALPGSGCARRCRASVLIAGCPQHVGVPRSEDSVDPRLASCLGFCRVTCWVSSSTQATALPPHQVGGVASGKSREA